MPYMNTYRMKCYVATPSIKLFWPHMSGGHITGELNIHGKMSLSTTKCPHNRGGFIKGGHITGVLLYIYFKTYCHFLCKTYGMILVNHRTEKDTLIMTIFQ